MRTNQLSSLSSVAQSVIVCLIVGVGLPSGAQAQAGLPTYRIENLDTGQFAEPSELFPEGGFLAGPVKISDNGQYVLTLVFDNRDLNRLSLPRHVALLDRQAGTTELIPEFFGRAWTLGVNNRGDALVVMQTLTGTQFRFWSRATGAIDYPGGGFFEGIIGGNDGTTGPLLNNSGQVLVGPDDFFLWDPVADSVIPIVNNNPAFPGAFSGIALNDAGEAVGSILRQPPDPSAPAGQVDVRAAIWNAADGMRILPDPGFFTEFTSIFIEFGRRVFANGINADGSIVGAVRDDQGTGVLFAAVWENETVLPELFPCTGPNQTVVPACTGWRIGNGGDVVGGFGGFASEGFDGHMVWDDTGDPHLLDNLVENGPERCLVDDIAADGTFGARCDIAEAALMIPVGGPGDGQAPVLSGLVADPNPVAIRDPVDLFALVDDLQSGGSTIAGASYTVDGGPPVAMSAEDGAFDSAVEGVTAVISGFDVSGIYEICATAEDSAGNVTEPACVLLAVYDPSAGFVTGGGWIDSPAGALAANAESTGKANFGFVVTYKRGASVPTGSTEFQFHQPGLNFHSEGYDWLIITELNQAAEFHGTGTINGAASPNGSPYRFMVQVQDGSPDVFRMRIWWDDEGIENVIYDNALTGLSGGSIVVHK